MRFTIYALVLLLTAQGVRGERFLTESEAAKLCFPTATSFQTENWTLTPEQGKAIEQRSKLKPGKEQRFWIARQGEAVLGVMMVDHVIGKHEFIDYAVAISTNAVVQQVEILEYREHYGGQVRDPKWRNQFKGKTAQAPLQPERDIYNVSGATLSCRHVTEGVRRILATYEVVVRPRLLMVPPKSEALKMINNTLLAQRSEPLLGTYVVISAYGTNHDQTQRAISDAFEEIKRIDSIMSLHRPDSELAGLNGHGAGQAQLVSEDLFRVLVKAQEISKRTDGSFDITVGPLTELWGFVWKEYRLPTTRELEAVLSGIGYVSLELNAASRSVRFSRNGMSLDLGGIAKGYAVDCAIEKLRALGISNAMVRAGGDLRVIGHPHGEADWPVQLEDPEKQGHRTTIRLKDAALSTSGDYENFFEVQGRRYSHILDPQTGMPVEGLAACSVIAPTCMESDALATALFVLGPERTFEKFGHSLRVRFVVSARNPLTPALSPKGQREKAAEGSVRTMPRVNGHSGKFTEVVSKSFLN